MRAKVRTEGVVYWVLFTAVWLATLHFGFDLGRHQGVHGFWHDTVPAAMGLGFITAWFADELEEAAQQRAEIAQVLHDLYMKES